MQEVHLPEEELYVIGTCKFFNTEKGYGFIELPGGGIDVFVHANQLRKSGIERPLNQGERVKFRTDKGPKGCFAVDVEVFTILS